MKELEPEQQRPYVSTKVGVASHRGGGPSVRVRRGRVARARALRDSLEGAPGGCGCTPAGPYAYAADMGYPGLYAVNKPLPSENAMPYAGITPSH